ncbi:hypothetical protein K0M31_000485 [Melipona bicolor]|uniref:Uncharacterized protein n=1 Tax=Melipona bicolor TaxID=60889 RepID=A0AA40GDL3_9HYME|nr:hypothetical protein K0M31_000485 [Melipona bicolor]
MVRSCDVDVVEDDGAAIGNGGDGGGADGGADTRRAGLNIHSRYIWISPERHGWNELRGRERG